MKVTFKKEKTGDNPFDCTEVTISVDSYDKSVIIEAFERFLLACGYSCNSLEEVEDND